ncbi:transposase [Streptomyces sp. NBC_01166]|uniref:transposase n=1 Tax=Streptomyces sp. NBC_01166 TaxID=2903755 RepID=UPI0038639B0C|nr:transposase [Streptomyces sp. NBC_01166]
MTRSGRGQSRRCLRRQMIDAIAWKLRIGSQRAHLPAEYGTWKGAYMRLRAISVPMPLGATVT